MKPNPLVAYMTILRVIQPARIQDIERYAKALLPPTVLEDVNENQLRSAHEEARASKLVLTVRRGVYALSHRALDFFPSDPLRRELDARRFYLIRSQRRRFN